jgi:hypothetical protein
MLTRKSLMRCSSVSALLSVCGLAQAQSWNFEPPLYTGSAAGTSVNGQDGWYTPAPAGSTTVDGFVYTYAGNPFGVAANPLGGQNFEGGVSPGGTTFVRAQHAVNFTGGSGVWEGILDVTGLFNGTLPAADNLGSFSFQPTIPAPGARYYQTLMRWNASTAPALITYPGGPALPDHSATADLFHIAIGHVTTAAPTVLSFSVPSADWVSRPVNHWYRTKLKWDFASSAVLSVSIQDLTAGGSAAVTDVSARGWYLNGGLNSTLPLPTDVRLFTGGSGVGNVAAWDNISLGPATVGSGACCLVNGGCQVMLQTACVSAGGSYAGDDVTCVAANCPPPGACCLFDGQCVVTIQTSCTNQGGVYQGNNTTCGTCTAFGYSEGANDAGDLPGTATSITGNGQALTAIFGTLDLDDVDMFKVKICNEANFSATTVGSGTTIDTLLYAFDLAGKGLVMSDDTSATVAQFSTITSQFINANGDYYIALSSFNNTTLIGRMPIDASAQQLFLPTAPSGFVYPEWAPNGPGAANAVTGWTGASETTGQAYRINLTGTCFLGGTSCYANCDGTGGLTANDFICFLTAYNQNQSYANCDQVGGLTANDFICFVSAYNAGCS